MATLRTCPCLNVTLYVHKQQQQQQLSSSQHTEEQLQLPSQLSGGLWAELVAPPPALSPCHQQQQQQAAVLVRHRCLFRHWLCCQSGWRLHSCLNCGQLTHGCHVIGGTEQGALGAAAAASFNDTAGQTVVINGNLLDSEGAGRVLASAAYSPWLGIAVLTPLTIPPPPTSPPSPPVAETAAGVDSLHGAALCLSPGLTRRLRRHPAVVDSVEVLSSDLLAYLKQEEFRVDAQIAQFREQKLQQLRELRDRVTADLQAVTRRLVSLDCERQSRLSDRHDTVFNTDNINNNNSSGGGTAGPPELSVSNTVSGECRDRSAAADDMGVFVMDDDDLWPDSANQQDQEQVSGDVSSVHTGTAARGAGDCVSAAAAAAADDDGEDDVDEDRSDGSVSVDSDSGVDAANGTAGAGAGAAAATAAVHLPARLDRLRSPVARSLPVHIPSPTAGNGGRRGVAVRSRRLSQLRRERVANHLDSDGSDCETVDTTAAAGGGGVRGRTRSRRLTVGGAVAGSDDSVPDMEHMGASIRQMALQSCDNGGDGWLYELPRPRTHTLLGLF